MKVRFIGRGNRGTRRKGQTKDLYSRILYYINPWSDLLVEETGVPGEKVRFIGRGNRGTRRKGKIYW